MSKENKNWPPHFIAFHRSHRLADLALLSLPLAVTMVTMVDKH